ncbi:MAG: YraN family protein [Flavobacteriaceae bacterium]|jgi:putative endonuclease|nr:YraN family protein [Flavobacteriaceae bacterium]
MAIHNDFGKEAEKKAAEFLKLSGYEIVERNWRFGKSEIDIIVRKGEELVIVEVKARSYDDVISPEEAVTPSKKKLLIAAADHYVIENELDVDVRFDIVSIIKKRDKWELTHIENAFDAIL